MGSGESMEWPPAIGIPASAQTALPPARISRTTVGGYLLIGIPCMASAMIGAPPIA